MVCRESAEDYEIWPENQLTVEVFLALHTQWRMVVGMAGAMYQGIEYASIPQALRMCRVPKRERQTVREGLQVMEWAALNLLNQRTES